MHIFIYLLLHQTQSKYAFGLEKFWFLSTLTMISLSLSTSFFSSDNLCVCVCVFHFCKNSKQTEFGTESIVKSVWSLYPLSVHYFDIHLSLES